MRLTLPTGYKSNASRALQAELLGSARDIMESNVHSRVLGNVLYLMTSQTTGVDTVRRLEQRLLRAEALGGTPEEAEEEVKEEAEEEAEPAESSDRDL